MERRIGPPRPEFKTFSEPARIVLNSAMDLAENRHSNYAGDGHLLLALMRDDSVAQTLLKLSLDREKIERSLSYYMTPLMQEEFGGEVKLTDTVYKIIGFAVDEAKHRKELPSAIDLLIGVIREGKGLAATTLQDEQLPNSLPLLETVKNVLSAKKSALSA